MRFQEMILVGILVVAYLGLIVAVCTQHYRAREAERQVRHLQRVIDAQVTEGHIHPDIKLTFTGQP